MADKNMESWNRYRQKYVGFANNATGETANQSQLTSGGYGNTYKGNSASQAQDNYLSKLYNNFANIYGTTDRTAGSGALNTDGLWQNYADQYVRGGRQAMRDTLGQYEANTGGYANSLATGAAAQAYYKYLDELNGQWPRNAFPRGRGGKAAPVYDNILDAWTGAAPVPENMTAGEFANLLSYGTAPILDNDGGTVQYDQSYLDYLQGKKGSKNTSTPATTTPTGRTSNLTTLKEAYIAGSPNETEGKKKTK